MELASEREDHDELARLAAAGNTDAAAILEELAQRRHSLRPTSPSSGPVQPREQTGAEALHRRRDTGAARGKGRVTLVARAELRACWRLPCGETGLGLLVGTGWGSATTLDPVKPAGCKSSCDGGAAFGGFSACTGCGGRSGGGVMADGDEATFTRIYREHADSIYAYLRYHLADPAMAEDVTAQVFLEAWRQRETVVIDPELGWAPWLFGVARNLVRVSSRTNARHALVDTDADSPAWGVVPDDREVIELCVIGSLTPKQAAAALGQPAPTVRSRLTRARRRLRALTTQILLSEEVLT